MSETWIEKWSVGGWYGYAFAFAAVLIGLALHFALVPFAGTFGPFAPMAPASIVVPLLCGLFPSVFMIALTMITGWFVMLADYSTSEKISSVLFAVSISFILFGVVLWLRNTLLTVAADRRTAERLKQEADKYATSADLLSRELNHRVRNLFGVVLSFVELEKCQNHPDGIHRLGQRIYALSRSHVISDGRLEKDLIPLREVVSASLEPYMDLKSDTGEAKVSMDGTDIDVPVAALTPLGLILHELGVNALKYGALSDNGGTVKVSWKATSNGRDTPVATLIWREKCAHPHNNAPEDFKPGFGSTMILGASKQLRGTYDRTWTRDGVDVTLSFPISILPNTPATELRTVEP